jgi:type VI secretion system protein ImpL
MKTILLKIFKITTLITLFFLILLLFSSLSIYAGYPWWGGLVLMASLIFLIVLFIFVRKIWMGKRENDFVTGMSKDDNSVQNEVSEDVRKRWKDAMKELRGSHLRKLGNPLYVLPWYLVIGESGSGKTTAIKNSGLSSTFSVVDKVSGISGTKNCDWWFFEKAIIIDTAGRYTMQGNDKDPKEWNLFLNQLSKYRKKEPINGLIVTISADKLLRNNHAELEEEGKKIRARVDELMMALGSKFPVHVMVTKCDLINGMDFFFKRLPPETLEQAMGTINHDPSADVLEFAKLSVSKVSSKLKDLRLHIINKYSERVEHELLLFPEDFEKLNGGLKTFFESSLKKSLYKEAPIIRGLFFSSGRQDGSAYSKFLESMEIKRDNNQNVTDNGMFLQDFFAKIIPEDRALYTPTLEKIGSRRFTKNIGIASWVTLMIAICGFLSLSFLFNLSSIKTVRAHFENPKIMTGDILSDVNTTQKLLDALLKLEAVNRSKWLPTFGLTHSKDVEEHFKKKFCKIFKKELLASTDKKMMGRLLSTSNGRNRKYIINYIPHIVRRINNIESSINENELPILNAMPKPGFKFLKDEYKRTVPDELIDMVSRQYTYYVLWEDRDVLAKRLIEFKNRIDHFVSRRDITLTWLVSWCNKSSGKAGIYQADYWGGRQIEEAQPVINYAYTSDGKEYIESFITEMKSTVTNPMNIAKKIKSYNRWYKLAYLSTWYRFGDAFPNGSKRLQDKDDKLSVIVKIAAKKGPYFTLLDRMSKELAPFARDKKIPAWTKLVFELDEVKKYASKNKGGKKKGVMSKMVKKGQKFMAKIEKKTGAGVGGSSIDFEKLVNASNAFSGYQSSLNEMTKSAVSNSEAYKLTSTAFKEDIATGETSIYTAFRNMTSLKVSMDNHLSSQTMFWNLLKGPLRITWQYLCIQSGCHLQSKWESEVLPEIEGVTNKKTIIKMLMGDEGYVTKFINGPAAPYLQKSSIRGYFPKSVLRANIGFSPGFFSFLQKGAFSKRTFAESYDIKIKALPIDTNKDANIIPHSTTLELECAGGVQSLVNLNYPISKVFKWSPKDCGDVNLLIKVGNLILKKRYTGYRPFSKFLKDFNKGRRIFKAEEFPQFKSPLKRMGIKYIGVNYSMAGHRPVIEMIEMATGRTPEVIVKCSK